MGARRERGDQRALIFVLLHGESAVRLEALAILVLGREKVGLFQAADDSERDLQRVASA